MSNFMNPTIVMTNIPEFKILAETSDKYFGRQIEASKKVKEWKEKTNVRSAWASQKRQSRSKAIKEIRELYGAKRYYARFGKNDDSFEVFFER